MNFILDALRRLWRFCNTAFRRPVPAPSIPGQKSLAVLFTQYFLAELNDPQSWRDWEGAGDMGVVIAGLGTRTYPVRFVNAVKGEGTGTVPEGVIQYDTFSHDFVLLDPVRYPHGAGAKDKPLATFTSIAVDPNVIPLGTKCFIEALKGKPVPNGTLHDGIVIADDTGGRIKGAHIDLFCEKKKWADKINRQLTEQVIITFPA